MNLRPIVIEPADRAARQRLVGSAGRQDRDLGAGVVVVAVGARIEAADFDPGPAIARDRDELPGLRELQDAPPGGFEHGFRRASACIAVARPSCCRKRYDLAHASSSQSSIRALAKRMSVRC